ncbi:metal ABC transporter permease [Lichenibacterium ramalinae]|uniref:Metal ABC transporter permease n=1 Tax=Lichenibacterium ramalinae TaxID=2316527 RepID=A0A4V1RIS5_9HYPH|nr:metal ABC transporter permease [Lichenibacterium ramalinae]RYB05302.1 metal ABC transporter permease [Lichenibacterium ramalinae]
MLAYDFMRTAFLASGIVAVLSGLVGYFLVLRNQTFAGHALSHVGFTGATGAILIGVPSLWGLVGFTLLAGLAMGALGEKLSARDVAIGMTLSLALGFGLLFLHFYTAFATQATALLFGNVLGVDRAALASLAVLGVASIVALACISRPLLFASLQPELAEARGVPLRLLSTAFLGIVAVAVSESAQIVGVLLVFTLMVGPGAAARNLSSRFGAGVALSAALAVAEAWGGLVLAWFTDWPVSFWITALSAAVYGLSLAAAPVAAARASARRLGAARTPGPGAASVPPDPHRRFQADAAALDAKLD